MGLASILPDRALLASDRLVTVTGPGGSGKTRLAGEVVRGTAQERDGGVVFVDLGSVRPGSASLSTGLPVPFAGRPMSRSTPLFGPSGIGRWGLFWTTARRG